jgi:phage-related minor tail protein
MQEDNAKKRNPLNEQQLQQEARKIHLINEQTVALEKQKKVQEDLIDFVADSMGDSFMSIVDGTKSVKDAFREMASDIVRELYRVLVVQQMVNSAKTFMGGFFADGGAFSGGSQIQAYADGGVVGSPTYFGMSGGKTGLMGEAGPEAIMPLSRGANGKLGVQAEGVGGVTINQNINISTGVQQTVRSEIKSMMPQIAEQSKAAVLDAKRRGGSYGSKF